MDFWLDIPDLPTRYFHYISANNAFIKFTLIEEIELHNLQYQLVAFGGDCTYSHMLPSTTPFAYRAMTPPQLPTPPEKANGMVHYEKSKNMTHSQGMGL